jgi:hypothetical protein
MQQTSVLVLTTINVPHSKKLTAQELACCLLHQEAAEEVPGHMASFFGEVAPDLQVAFANQFGITDAQLRAAATAFSKFSGQPYPLAA